MLRPFSILFWQSSSGRQPVREFLKEQAKGDRLRLGEDLRRLQFGWLIGMPLVRKMGASLWELRSSVSGNREIRILFTSEGETLILLHGFVKKSQKTPKADFDLAIQRMKE